MNIEYIVDSKHITGDTGINVFSVSVTALVGDRIFGLKTLEIPVLPGDWDRLQIGDRFGVTIKVTHKV